MVGMLDEPDYWAINKIAAIRPASMGRMTAKAFAPAKIRGCGRIELTTSLKDAWLQLKGLLVMVWFIGRKPNENRKMFVY